MQETKVNNCVNNDKVNTINGKLLITPNRVLPVTMLLTSFNLSMLLELVYDEYQVFLSFKCGIYFSVTMLITSFFGYSPGEENG